MHSSIVSGRLRSVTKWQRWCKQRGPMAAGRSDCPGQELSSENIELSGLFDNELQRAMMMCNPKATRILFTAASSLKDDFWLAAGGGGVDILLLAPHNKPGCVFFQLPASRFLFTLLYSSQRNKVWPKNAARPSCGLAGHLFVLAACFYTVCDFADLRLKCVLHQVQVNNVHMYKDWTH